MDGPFSQSVPVELGGCRSAVGQFMTAHVIHVGVGHETPWLATSYVYGQVNGGQLDTTVKMKHESAVAR